MARTLIDIPDDMVKQLDFLAREKQISRSELIRTALKALLKKHQEQNHKSVFGILKDEKIEDPIEFQQKLREEW